MNGRTKQRRQVICVRNNVRKRRGRQIAQGSHTVMLVMAHKRPNLPEKTCIVCGRSFSWRKKWKKVWDEVKYCSDRCRNHRKTKAIES